MPTHRAFVDAKAYLASIGKELDEGGKTPTEWAKDMNDEVLTTALMDRLLYHCEVIKLDGNSYRMENRKTIFEKKKEV